MCTCVYTLGASLYGSIIIDLQCLPMQHEIYFQNLDMAFVMVKVGGCNIAHKPLAMKIFMYTNISLQFADLYSFIERQ